MTLQGIVQGYNGLIITRTLLGLAESGFFPATTYLLTTWYCRFEIRTQLAIFFSPASMAGAFSGLLAFAIESMDGVGGLREWR
jgi:MFS family permease